MTEPTATLSIRDAVGRAIYSLGKTLHRLGLWLCGVAGWWDAGTDGRGRSSATEEADRG